MWSTRIVQQTYTTILNVFFVPFRHFSFFCFVLYSLPIFHPSIHPSINPSIHPFTSLPLSSTASSPPFPCLLSTLPLPPLHPSSASSPPFLCLLSTLPLPPLHPLFCRCQCFLVFLLFLKWKILYCILHYFSEFVFRDSDVTLLIQENSTHGLCDRIFAKIAETLYHYATVVSRAVYSVTFFYFFIHVNTIKSNIQNFILLPFLHIVRWNAVQYSTVHCSMHSTASPRLSQYHSCAHCREWPEKH